MELLREPPPAIVSEAAEWLRNIPSGKSVLPQRMNVGDQATLIKIDDGRYCNPRSSLEEAQALLRKQLSRESTVDSARQVLFLLGVIGSASRMLSHQIAAHHALGTALNAAFELGVRDGLFLSLVRRSVYVSASQGEWDLALQIAKWSCRKYDENNDMQGKGKALVDCGLILLQKEKYSDAFEAYGQAQEMLTESSERHWYAAQFGLAKASYHLGNIDEAHRYLAKVRQYVPPEDRHALAMVNLLEARIHRSLGNEISSFRCFREAIQLLRQTDEVVELVLASVDAVELLLDTGRTASACSFAERMIALSFKLSRHRVLWEAIDRLIEAARKGELSLAIVRAVRGMVEKGRPLQQAPFGANP